MASSFREAYFDAVKWDIKKAFEKNKIAYDQHMIDVAFAFRIHVELYFMKIEFFIGD